MGVFSHTIEIGDPAGARFQTVEAMVDTGATFTSVPTSILSRLGVVPGRQIRLRLADGSRIDRGLGETIVRVQGNPVTTLVVFGEEDAPILLGAYTLEGLTLVVDPVEQRLVSADALMLSQHFTLGTKDPRDFGGEPCQS